ncbi:YadA-like family protein [Phascolarctobacterium succinatutens]|uniref:YadA-like family protein n=1 Tax=Phascolarctobacterium succinatutens TaxID=626940 RepID=UPI0026EA1A19|nr:YadA-like family protein [Phascolarctobacterium succinatutens]
MKKTLAKAIIFAVVVGGICYQSGPVYAGEPWNYGSDKIEIIDKDIAGYDGLKDPTVQHTHNGGDYHNGHDEKCKEDADRLYVGDVAKMKDTLVENDKALAKKIEELERTPGPKGDKGDKGDRGEQGIQGEDGASIATGNYKVENNTVVMPIKYTNGESAGNVTINDVASAAQNDREHAEFREHFSELDHRVDNLGSRVDKVGAGAAALAALHPMDFDPDDKLTFAAGYGNYKGKNAAAVGAFYRPDEKVMLSVGGTFGNGENMVNAGISFSLDRTARVSNSRTAMAKEIVDLRANVANLTALVGQLTAGMGGTIEMDRMKLFPDVPENHWAYEYIGRLAAAGIVEGYPDGMFNGNRMMSRYEFAAMLYRALEKGVKLDHKLVREFEPEMGRIHVARISGADGDRGKIERVRVYGGDNRDHYGSKLK